jgi:hypothetical protein|tara:strand:- start:499 stop:642 length:144 start_codon:yes stop_codon:yes gene_type:complete
VYKIKGKPWFLKACEPRPEMRQEVVIDIDSRVPMDRGMLNDYARKVS